MKYQLLQGDNRDTLKTLADNSVDAIITDPPYGIDFLGKEWDANTGALETYRECLRVLKPGGHILAFSAARTYHHLAITLEQAGFEIRDQIMWIYSSGFPKSQDVGKSIARSENKVKNTKTYLPDIDDNRSVANSTTGSPRCQMCDKSTGPIWKKCPDDRADCIKPWQADLQDNAWNGWGTALKPAHEPIALARKPLNQSIAKNVQQWGTGALNIDATRITIQGEDTRSGGSNGVSRLTFGEGITSNEDSFVGYEPNDLGRFPSNVVGELGEYQKYFYCPKVSRKERHMGFAEHTPTQADMLQMMGGHFIDENGNKKESQDGSNMLWLPHTGNIYIHGLKHEYEKWCKANNVPTGNVGNNHPTVKPVALMEYLVKLITPPNGTVLDPFNGSGSTGMAAVGLGFGYIGCELDPNYVAISERRIQAWLAKDPLLASGLFE